MHQVIHIHPEAPPKPATGQPCNGCGVCCLAEPCPVGMLVSRKRHGACKALVWVEADRRYRCGLMLAGQRGSGLWRKAWHRWAARWISAGSGCDADIEVATAAAPPPAQSLNR
jgi:hypothetical protein